MSTGRALYVGSTDAEWLDVPGRCRCWTHDPAWHPGHCCFAVGAAENCHEAPEPCEHTRTGPTGIEWICTAAQGPPPGARPDVPHSHYYIRRYQPQEET